MLPDAFGCAVANRFGNLLDDEADPLDLLSEAAKVKERKRKDEEEKKAKLKKAVQKESQKDRRLPRSTPGPDPLPGWLACSCTLAGDSGSIWVTAARHEGGFQGLMRLEVNVGQNCSLL